MKATTIIIAAVLSLQAGFLFAGDNEPNPRFTNEAVSFNMNALAPVTPGEATFEETTFTKAFNIVFTNLAPTTPVEADFSDVVSEKNVDLTILAPVTPPEADFNETIEIKAMDFSNLAPETPVVADFE